MIPLTAVAGLAALGQFLIAFLIFRVQLSNERIANRIELFARTELFTSPAFSTPRCELVISNLSTLGVWIEYVTLRAVDQATEKPVQQTVPFGAVIPGGGSAARPLKSEIRTEFRVTTLPCAPAGSNQSP